MIQNKIHWNADVIQPPVFLSYMVLTVFGYWSFMAQRYKLLQALATQTVVGLTRSRMKPEEAACKYNIISV